MGEMISFKRPDGGRCEGYLAGAAKAPGIVVIQEWWGLNDQIKRVADRFVAAGYRVLVPDLFRGRVTMEAKEAEHLMKDLNFVDAASQDVRGAVQYLGASGSAHVGVSGYCMGGALTVLGAMLVPESDANVTWYGYPPLEYVDAAKIKAPLLGHFGTLDQFFAIGGVDALEAKLKEARVGYEFHRYEAKHAFANEEADSMKLPPLGYDPKAAALAWDRTLAFFEKHLH